MHASASGHSGDVLLSFPSNLSYPPPAPFPTVDPPYVGSDASAKLKGKTSTLKQLLKRDALSKRSEPLAPEQLEKKELWKRDLSGRANGTIDPFYGCFLLDELIDYATNFTFPWCKHARALKACIL